MNQNIFFPVRMVSAETVLNMPTVSKKLKRAVVGTIEGTDTIIHIGGKNYTLVSNSTLYPLIKERLEAESLDFTEGLTESNFSKFWGRYVINTPVEIAEGYEFKPTIIVTNSYDGELKLDFTFGILTKGGQFISVAWESKNKKHTESVEKFVDSLVFSVESYLEVNSEIISQQFGKLIETEVLGWEQKMVDIVKELGLFKTHKIEKGVETIFTEDMDLVIRSVKENMGMFGLTIPNNFILLTALSEWVENSDKAWKAKLDLNEDIRKILEK